MKPEYLAALIVRFRRSLQAFTDDMARDEQETLTRDYAIALFEVVSHQYSKDDAEPLMTMKEYTESALRLQKNTEAAQ